jgi:hypothetical protein
MRTTSKVRVADRAFGRSTISGFPADEVMWTMISEGMGHHSWSRDGRVVAYSIK